MAENENTVEEGEVVVQLKEKKKPNEGFACAAAAAMVHRSPLLQLHNLDKLLATITLLFSLPILGFIVWLFYVKDSDCESILKLPSLQLGIGIGLIVLFLVSNAVVLLRSHLPILGLLAVMVPLMLIFIIGLALVGAFKMENRSVRASPRWFRVKVFDNTHWDNIKSCIYDTGACDDLVSRTLMLRPYDFSLKKFSSIESGCCKPAAICEMEYVNATFWIRREGAVKRSNVPYNSDCDLWDNERSSLCYNCMSCKRGFLRTIQSKWWRLGVFLVVASLLLIIAHLLLFVSSVYQQYQT